ncbi:MAG: MFS transporter [Gammaproteobacteria bacterium]|nr:MFS transporter [Gammaproteobacteria bacterium]
MCVAQVLTMLGAFAFPALVPGFLDEWGLSYTEAGWVSGIYFAGYAVAVPMLASLTDRRDARAIYLIFALVGGCGSLLFALLAQGFWSALVFRVLGGVGLAGTFIPGLKAQVDRLAGSTQSRAIAWYTATFSLGTSVSFLVSGEIGSQFGWRAAFGIAAAATIVAAVMAAITLRRDVLVAVDSPQTHLLDFRPVIRNRRAMAYILGYAAHMWELFGVRSWMVAFLTFCLSVQAVTADYWTPTTVMAIAGFLAMCASIGGAELSLRWGHNAVLKLFMWASAACAFGIGFAAELYYPLVVALCLGYAMLVQGDSAVLHAGTVQSAEPARRGATMAVQSLCGFLSACLSPLVVGLVLDTTGGGSSVASWGAAFITMGIVVAFGPLIMRLVRGPQGGVGSLSV